MIRPRFISEDLFAFLNGMDQDTMNNMFSAVPAILAHNPELTPREAQAALMFWHQTQIPTEVLVVTP